MTDPMLYVASFMAPADILDVSDIFKHGYSRAGMEPVGGTADVATVVQLASE